MIKSVQILVTLFLICLLVLVRFLENNLFYDPLISFFKTDYQTQSLPQLDSFKLLWNVFLRFALNTLISLALLWVIFKDKEIIKFSSLLYGILFLLLFSVFYYLVFSANSQNHLPLFYVRRFLIQPLLVLILVPAFYFQKSKN